MMRSWPIGSMDHSPPEGQRHQKADRRTIFISFRVTERESWLLAEAADAEGRSVTEVVRARVFGPLPPLGDRT